MWTGVRPQTFSFQTTDYFLDAANYGHRRADGSVGNPTGNDRHEASCWRLHDLTYYDVRDDSPLVTANLVPGLHETE